MVDEGVEELLSRRIRGTGECLMEGGQLFGVSIPLVQLANSHRAGCVPEDCGLNDCTARSAHPDSTAPEIAGGNNPLNPNRYEVDRSCNNTPLTPREPSTER